jgi:predicted RNase H-like nuclease
MRIEALLTEFNAIFSALVAYFGDIELQLPMSEKVTHLARLKRYEDSLDALICAWVGAEHLAGRTIALGDDTAAIWCPNDVVFGSLKTGLQRS